MTLIKVLQVECTICGHFEEVTALDDDFEKWLNAEDDACPNCMKLAAEKI